MSSNFTQFPFIAELGNNANGNTQRELVIQQAPVAAGDIIGKTLVDVTNSKLPANGSYGSISIDKFERTNGTASLYLKNVLVTEMIEYVQEESSYNPGDEFDDEPKAEKPKAKPEAKAPAAKPKARAKVEEVEDDDIPF